MLAPPDETVNALFEVIVPVPVVVTLPEVVKFPSSSIANLVVPFDCT